MKQMKKLLSAIVALAMVIVMAMPAFASLTTPTPQQAAANNAKHTITIETDENYHTFTAYRIFKGRAEKLADSTLTLSDVEWAIGDDAVINLKKALWDVTTPNHAEEGTTEENGETVKNPYADLTAAQIAEQIGNGAGKTITAEQFALAASKIKDQLTSVGTSGAFISGKGYEIEVEGDGYYLIVDTATRGDASNSATNFILEVVDDATAHPKADVPQIDKSINEANVLVDANQKPVGGTVDYELHSAVPDMSNYKKYYFVVEDKLSKGLTPVDGDDADTLIDVQIEIGWGEKTTDAEGAVHYEHTEKPEYVIEALSGTLEGEYAGGYSFRVGITNFKAFCESHGIPEGADIKITYQATVNADAVIGVTGNPNEARLKYSNNPNNDQGGDTFPENDDVVGITPWDDVRTLVTGIQLVKVDGNETSKKLAGAVFKISGTQQEYVVVTGERFVYAGEGEGEYYKLKDETYTKEAPNEETQDKYAETTPNYNKEDIKESKPGNAEGVDLTVTTGENGIAIFDGIGEGKFTITEIQAPDGYNLLAEPIEIEVKAIKDEAGKVTGWNWRKVGEGDEAWKNVTEQIEIEVKNNQGSTLPETGGIGTTIFYIVGAILVIGAAVLLVTKKRMKGQQQ